jgi:hypothetical protein
VLGSPEPEANRSVRLWPSRNRRRERTSTRRGLSLRLLPEADRQCLSVHAFFAEEQVVAITGETKSYNGLEVDGVGALGGSEVDSHFCATCGSTVYWDLMLSNGYREVGVAVGNFVDPAFPMPAVEYSTTLRHRWVPPVPAADQFDTIPSAYVSTHPHRTA